MSFIERTASIISRALKRFVGKLVASAADQVAQGMTAKCITREKKDIRRQNNRAESDAETVRKPIRFVSVIRQKNQKY